MLYDPNMKAKIMFSYNLYWIRGIPETSITPHLLALLIIFVHSVSDLQLELNWQIPSHCDA